MRAYASALTSGSMSLAFSGHTTRSGCSVRPAATCLARARVASTWLSSTARRWALKSRPSRGTLPCTTATVTVRPAGGGVGTAAAPAVRATAITAGRITAVPVARRRPGRSAPRTAAASSPPASATPNVTSGAPPSRASPSSGESAWLKASRPHGNPPKGVRSRSLLRGPQHAGDQRGGPPPAGHHRSGDRRGGPEQREVHRLQPGQQQPRQRAHVQSGPGQQRNEEHGAGQRAEPGAGTRPPAGDREVEQRDPDRRERPQPVRRERQQQGHPGAGGEQRGQPATEPATGPATGPASGGGRRVAGRGRRDRGAAGHVRRRHACRSRFAVDVTVDVDAILPGLAERRLGDRWEPAGTGRDRPERTGTESGRGRRPRPALPGPFPAGRGSGVANPAFVPTRRAPAVHAWSLSTGRA